MKLNQLSESSVSHLARMGGFYLSVVAFVAILVVLMGEILLFPFTAWFDPAAADVHFVHDVTFLSMLLIVGLAMLVQLYRPAERVVAMQFASLVALFTILTTSVSSGFDPMLVVFIGPVVLAGVLHPARRELLRFRAYADGSVNRVLLVLVVAAAIPVAVYAVGELTLQATLTDDHAAIGHYASMATYVLTIVTLVTIAAVSGAGHRLAVYIAGFLAVLLAVGSVFQPTVSAISTTWAALAVLWAIAVVAAAHWPATESAAGDDAVDAGDADDGLETDIDQQPAAR